MSMQQCCEESPSFCRTKTIPRIVDFAAGRPCSFPFVYRGVNESGSGSLSRYQCWIVSMTQGNLVDVREERTFSTCTSLDDVTPWCYTRTRVIPDNNHDLQDQASLRAGFVNFLCRKISAHWTATGATAPPTVRGSCPRPPASTA